MSIDRIELQLRKKYYDGNMVREAVMSVTDDYNTIMKLLSAFADQPPLTDVIEVVRCKDCRYWDTSREWTGREGKHKCEIDNLIVPPDGYCHVGERRDDETKN